MKKSTGIYRISLGNGWFYIGSAVNLKRREGRHRSDLKFEVHGNKRMQNCWNKYKIFEFTILEECDAANLIVREQNYLDTHFNDEKNVNLCQVAGSCLGRKHSAEARAKMSAWQIGRKHSAATKQKMSAAAKNMSAETRAKMSAAQQNVSVETRSKLSAATKLRYARERAAA